MTHLVIDTRVRSLEQGPKRLDAVRKTVFALAVVSSRTTVNVKVLDFVKVWWTQLPYGGPESSDAEATHAVEIVMESWNRRHTDARSSFCRPIEINPHRMAQESLGRP